MIRRDADFKALKELNVNSPGFQPRVKNEERKIVRDES
jgi:hypothetical protein